MVLYSIVFTPRSQCGGEVFRPVLTGKEVLMLLSPLVLAEVPGVRIGLGQACPSSISVFRPENLIFTCASLRQARVLKSPKPITTLSHMRSRQEI
jgi:hypothetical protein